MEPIVVKDFESALAAVKSLAQADGREIQIPEEGNLVIKLTGEQWDGKLDYKVAEFITRLQREIVTLHNISSGADRRFSSKFVEENGLRVTVTLEQGCSRININLSEWFRNMSPAQTIIALTIVTGIIGSVYAVPEMYKSYNDKTVAIYEINAKIQSSISGANIPDQQKENIQNAVRYSLDNPQSMPYLASQMKPGDTMRINDIELTPDEAKSIYKTTVSHNQEMLEKEFILDMEYEIVSADLRKSSIVIQFEDKKRTFSLVRNDFNVWPTIRNKLEISNYGIIHKIPLRLTGVFKGGVFIHGYVDGVGEPREGAMDIQSASLASASMEEDAEQEGTE